MLTFRLGLRASSSVPVTNTPFIFVLQRTCRITWLISWMQSSAVVASRDAKSKRRCPKTGCGTFGQSTNHRSNHRLSSLPLSRNIEPCFSGPPPRTCRALHPTPCGSAGSTASSAIVGSSGLPTPTNKSEYHGPEIVRKHMVQPRYVRNLHGHGLRSYWLEQVPRHTDDEKNVASNAAAVPAAGSEPSRSAGACACEPPPSSDDGRGPAQPPVPTNQEGGTSS